MPPTENNKATVLRKKEPNPPLFKGKNYLFVIGIDTYAHCPTLYNAVKDAKDLVEVLQTRFQFEKENTTALYNDKATKGKIYAAFRDFKRKVTAKDNFIVYFSGHGDLDKDFGLGYWIPVNAVIEATEDYMPNSLIRNMLSSIESHHTFLMVDSCFSGALFAKGTGRNVSLRKERDPSRWGLTAGRNEIVTDGQPGKNSPFADSILYQLKNTNNPIGVAELCDKVLEIVSANADQTPRGEPLKVDGHKGGQFVFHLKKDELADWKAALAADSIAVYQSFIIKYPTGKYATDAKLSVNRLQADSLWQKIDSTKETNLSEVSTKLRLVNQYVDSYEEQPHYEEALDVGELLEYKKQFLQAKTSEFALRRFLRNPTPNIPGANKIKTTAQQLVNNWGTEKPVVSTPSDTPSTRKIDQISKPPKRKEQVKPKEIKPNPPKPSPSFFEKYGKYLVLLFFVPLGIWGISKAMSTGGTTEPIITPPIIEETIDDTKKEEELSVIDNKPTKEDLQKAALTKAQKSYNSNISKGDTELRKSRPNYQVAKKYYEDAKKAAKGFAINTRAATDGVKKCNTEIAKQNDAEREKQRRAKLARLQKEYDQLIREGNSYYDKGEYQKAKEIYESAKGKISNNNAARRGITNCQSKLDEIEKKRRLRAQQQADENAWSAAKKKNTIPAYEYYQSKYPKGKYYKDASSQIIKLKKSVVITNTNAGTFKDSRDKQTYKWIRLKDGKKWMAQNLNYKTSNSWCYKKSNSNCSKYGRLYTWKAALTACPKGWHLPSDEEWWKMASYYGKAYSSSKKNTKGNAGEVAYKALMKGGNSGFSALFGGGRTSGGDFRSLGGYGDYWSSSEGSSSDAWHYRFLSSSKGLHRSDSNKSAGFSCRCFQD